MKATYSLPRSIVDAIRRIAQEEDTNMSTIVSMAVEMFVQVRELQINGDPKTIKVRIKDTRTK